jgi:hypothetical protein
MVKAASRGLFLGGSMANRLPAWAFVPWLCLGPMVALGADPSVTIRVPGTQATTVLEPPGPPDAAAQAEGYFAIGPWRIGMPREEALGKFRDVTAIEGDTRFTGVADTYFASGLPAELTFADGKLHAVKLQLYDGVDLEQAVQRIMDALLYMHHHFGGSNFEGGIKTHKDPEGKLLMQVLRHAIEKFDHGLAAAEEKQKQRKGKRKRARAPQSYTTYEMVFNFHPEVKPEKNFLLGEYRYRSDVQRSVVSLYDDREFVPSRIPDATVMLMQVPGERPAPAAATPVAN